MAVEVLNSIPELAWTLNPLRVEMRSNLKIEQEGQKYVGYIGFWNVDRPDIFIPPAVNSVITLQMYGVTHQFVFRESPVMGNNELPVYHSSMTGAAWIASLRDYFMGNSLLSNNYTITISTFIERNTNPGDIAIRDSPPYIRFESKEADDRSTIEFYGEEIGLIVSNYLIGVSPVYRKNLKIYVELWVNDGVDSIRLLAVNMPTDQSGKAVVDISNPLHMHASLRMHDQTATAGMVRYYLSYTDVYGDQQVSGNIQSTAEKYVLYGGVPNSRIGESVSDSLVKEGLIQWLSPKDLSNEVVVRGQEYILTLFNPLATKSDVKVCAKLYYPDAVQHEVILSTLVLPHKGKIYVNAMDIAILEAYPEENLLRWEIYLRHEDVIISSVAGFSMQENPFYVYSVKYINSYGAIAYANLYGKAVKGYGIEMESAELLGTDGMAQTQSIAIQLKDKYTLRTGYMSRAVLESWRDFVLSTSKCIRVGNRWISVVLKAKEVTEIVDGIHLYALEFEFEGISYSRVWGYN